MGSNYLSSNACRVTPTQCSLKAVTVKKEFLSPATYPPGVAPASMARQRISVTASIVFCAAAAGHAIAWNAFCRGAARRGAARRAKPRTRATLHLWRRVSDATNAILELDPVQDPVE